MYKNTKNAIFYTNFPKIWYINFGDWMKKEAVIEENKIILDTDHYNFLIERENKLQMIEQMFKSGTVDLSELAELVEEKWKKQKKKKKKQKMYH